MKKINSTIDIEVDYSEDKTCRFGYTKKWNALKSNATFILMNPSKGTEFKLDNTIVNINNYCIENDFGSFTILNLFPFMATSPSELTTEIRELFSCENKKYIKEKLTQTNDVFIAWGSERKFIKKKKEIEGILNLSQFKSKNIQCWKKGNDYPKHLRIISKDWILCKYIFKHIQTRKIKID